MTQIIDAIFENGAFRPVHPEQVQAADGQLVTLVVKSESLPQQATDSLPEPLRLAARVYQGMSSEEIDAIEKIALDRSGFGDGNTSDS